MKGLELKTCIMTFGKIDGFKFWFKMNLIDELKQWYWLNITHKPYCLWAGWYCKDKDCKHKHLLTKKEVLEEWEKTRKEIESVEEGKNGMCVYCEEEKGTEKIMNPNMDKINSWLVCKDCKEVIQAQHEQSFGMGLMNLDDKHKDFNEKYGKKIVNDANKKLDVIAKRTGKPIMSACLSKGKEGYDVSSVEFTGEKDERHKNKNK